MMLMRLVVMRPPPPLFSVKVFKLKSLRPDLARKLLIPEACSTQSLPSMELTCDYRSVKWKISSLAPFFNYTGCVKGFRLEACCRFGRIRGREQTSHSFPVNEDIHQGTFDPMFTGLLVV